ncbi:hypothetical protein RQP46_010034 [Phenoliferia psychrophenolica]
MSSSPRRLLRHLDSPSPSPPSQSTSQRESSELSPPPPPLDQTALATLEGAFKLHSGSYGSIPADSRDALCLQTGLTWPTLRSWFLRRGREARKSDEPTQVESAQRPPAPSAATATSATASPNPNDEIIDAALFAHGPSYKSVKPHQRAHLCHQTGLDLGGLKKAFMNRAQFHKKQKAQAPPPPPIVVVVAPPTPSTPFQQLPPGPPFSRTLSLPASLRESKKHPRLEESALDVLLGGGKRPALNFFPSFEKRPLTSAMKQQDESQHREKRRRKAKKPAVIEWGGEEEEDEKLAGPPPPVDFGESEAMKKLVASIAGILPKQEEEEPQLELEQAGVFVSNAEHAEMAYEDLRASVGEVDDIVFFQATSLDIGSWHRSTDPLDPRPDLRCYFSPSRSAICIWSTHEFPGTTSHFHTRLTLPLAALTSLKFFTATSASSSSALLLLTRDRSHPISFHTSRPTPPGSTPIWLPVADDLSPGAQASHHETYALTLLDARHAFDRLLELPLFLSPESGDDFLGRIWIAPWPTFGKRSLPMPPADIVRCLQAPPLDTEWGYGEMVAFRFASGERGEPDLVIRRSFVKPAPLEENDDELKDVKEEEIDEEEIWERWVEPKAFEDPFADAVEDEEQSSSPPESTPRRHHSRTPPPPSSPTFDIHRDWTGNLPPSSFYLTPPPEATLNRNSSATTTDSDASTSASQQRVSRTPLAPISRTGSSTLQNYMGEMELDDVVLISPSPSPQPDFDYTRQTAEAFQSYWMYDR